MASSASVLPKSGQRGILGIGGEAFPADSGGNFCREIFSSSSVCSVCPFPPPFWALQPPPISIYLKCQSLAQEERREGGGLLPTPTVPKQKGKREQKRSKKSILPAVLVFSAMSKKENPLSLSSRKSKQQLHFLPLHMLPFSTPRGKGGGVTNFLPTTVGEGRERERDWR